MGAFLAFHPRDLAQPKVTIIEKSDTDWRQKISQYQSVIETYNVVDQNGNTVWQPGNSDFPQVTLAGVDAEGRLLLFFHSGYAQVHTLGEYIKSLPLDLRGLLYLDGSTKGAMNFAKETGRSSLGSDPFLPNIIGITRKPTPLICPKNRYAQ